MQNYRRHLKPALISALGYGLGFVVGVIFIELVLNIGLLESIADNFENQRLYVGIFILFAVVILGGALAGLIGSWVTSAVVGFPNRMRSIARSSLGIGTGFGLVLLPVTGLIAMMAMYNAGDASPGGFIVSMGVVGALFGLVAGLMTGTLPSKVSYWRVAGVAALSFGIGGLAFGFGLWHYFYTLYQSGAAPFELLAAFFLFGGVGGFFMGWLFSLDRERAAREGEPDVIQANTLYRLGEWFKSTKFYRKRGFWGTVLIVALLFLLSRLLAMSPLNTSASHIADFLPSNTDGVHWSQPRSVSEPSAVVNAPSIAQFGDTVAITWVQEGEVFLSTARPNGDQLWVWEPGKNISDSGNANSQSPQVVIDPEERLHLVWAETRAGEAGASAIFYRSCLEDDCTPAVTLSDSQMESCGSETNLDPVITINGKDILVVWSSNTDNLPYASWQIGSDPPAKPSGCALAEAVPGAAHPRLASQGNDGVVLAFEADGLAYVTRPGAPENFSIWQSEPGHAPEVYVAPQGELHVAWCGEDGQIRYRSGSLIQTVAGPDCLSRPALGQDTDGILHLLWYADQVEQVSGELADSNLIYESRRLGDGWSEPVIISLSDEAAQPALVTGTDGLLHLAWQAEQVNYASYQVFECNEADLNLQGQLALEVAQSGEYRPADDIVPYCHNQFDRLLILPKPDPAYSDIPPTLNGAFDQVSDLIQTAQYEVLLSTMWYESDDTGTSPGHVLGQGIKDLYDKVKAHPEQYPRGMTVRILLDNPPEFTLSNLISQLWNVFQHLRAAGVPTMSDPEIGWNLQVANYAGSWPHGHTKMIVIDGKTAIAAGFNYQHKHQSKDHPSGKGKDDYDLGLQMTGPVAQATQLAFDDLWYGSNLIVCPDLGDDSPLWWLTCQREFATAEHVPEAQKYYLADANSNAFALHRTKKFNESDITVAKTVASAQETLDVLQVNFTLKLICDLNVIFRVCDFNDALSYMEAMMDAIEANQVKTRVLIKPGPIEAVESNIAIVEFRRRLEERGLSDLVEFRYFNDSVHAKAVLVDNQFLLVGSQNFHYSAFGEGGGLTEFNIGTDDPGAIEAFQRFFNYHWERGTPIPEK